MIMTMLKIVMVVIILIDNNKITMRYSIDNKSDNDSINANW